MPGAARLSEERTLMPVEALELGRTSLTLGAFG